MADDVDDAEAVIRVEPDIARIPPATWDACAIPEPATLNPFVSHAFLAALEASGCVGRRAGWLPQHLVLEERGAVVGVAPAYLKAHSRGEYVFDYGWAEAYERAGGAYYPKLQIAVPFTPVPGPRLMALPGDEAPRRRLLLGEGAAALAQRHGLSSVHVTFLTPGERVALASVGYLTRTGQQFHWTNHGYADFEEFLGSFASRKRKAVRKERAEAVAAGLDITWHQGRDITEAHWDAFFAFYMDTGSRKWGTPYLNRRFFSLLGETMGERCLLIMARRGGRPIAGALNIIGGDCLYGRYWGAIEHHSCLHFEVCYYQAIDYAIAHKLARVEAGAQGEHKLARGYMPTETSSSHWIADRGFRRAVERFLDEERKHVAAEGAALAELGPYRNET